jgi:hypothetical protein
MLTDLFFGHSQAVKDLSSVVIQVSQAGQDGGFHL